jgi:hypothetical protein
MKKTSSWSDIKLKVSIFTKKIQWHIEKNKLLLNGYNAGLMEKVPQSKRILPVCPKI